MTRLGKFVRRCAVWVAFKFLPVDHPDAVEFINSRIDSKFIEDEHTIRRALEVYYWVRRIVD